MNSFYLTPYWMKQEDWGGGGAAGQGTRPISSDFLRLSLYACRFSVYLKLTLSSTISNSWQCFPLRLAMSYAVSPPLLRRDASSHRLHSSSSRVEVPSAPVAARCKEVNFPLVCALISAPFCSNSEATAV